MASSSKNQGPSKRISLSSEVDMISKLPDEVIVHILSFLTTKDAFKTGLLSSRLEKLWTAVANLDFRPKHGLAKFDSQDVDPRYMDFIKKIFMSHNSSVNKFHIHCTPQIDVDCLSNWINAVVERNVLDIAITHFDTYLKLPDSLFTSKTLVTLKLAYFLQFDIPTSIHFPCLKVFHISVNCPRDDFTRNLFCSSPVLEELRIDVDRDYVDSVYNISSLCLKKLFLSIKTFRSKNFDTVVNIDAPVLDNLEVDYANSAHYILKNSPSLIKASISADLCCCHDETMIELFPLGNLIMLLKSVSFVKDLSLDGHFLIAVFSSSSEINWPVFSNVTRLELHIKEDFDSPCFSRWPVYPNVKHLQLNIKNKYFASEHLPDLLVLVPMLISLVYVKEILVKYAGSSTTLLNNGLRVVLCLVLMKLKYVNLMGWRGSSI